MSAWLRAMIRARTACHGTKTEILAKGCVYETTHDSFSEVVIKFYLDGEAVKKNRSIPSTFETLDLDDPNVTDQWLREHDYKDGVLSGFAQWALVELSVDDIGNIAIVNHIFKSNRVLKNLTGTREFEDWIPNRNPLPFWFGPLSANEWRDEYSIILRPPTPGERSEGAALYVEDGSGRSICYYRSL
ncbi:MAG TPA: hypothetical protein VKF63_09940, partial [Terracidiphilus sp.]|nr:hypothetical protein [Terracidiphilus sp.]